MDTSGNIRIKLNAAEDRMLIGRCFNELQEQKQ